MIYSVFKPETGLYDYYEAPAKAADAQAPVPPKLAGTEPGVSADDAAWNLPAGAVKTGSGKDPRGMIATVGGVSSSGVSHWLLYGLAGLGLYFLAKRFGVIK